jgi:exopolysaccharide biosynthesis polyprenyl glycosylphosphotransferase
MARISSFRLHRAFLGGLLIADSLALVASFLGAWWIRFDSGLVPVNSGVPPFRAYLAALPLTLAVFLIVFNYSGLYRRRISVVGTADTPTLARAVALASLLVFSLGWFYRGFSYSRLVLLIMAGVSVVLLKVLRQLLVRSQERLAARGIGVMRVVVAGGGPEALEVAGAIRNHPGYGFRILGFAGERHAGLSPWLGPASRLGSILARRRPDALLLAPPRRASRGEVAGWAQEALKAGVECRMLADVFGMLTGRLRLEELFGLPVFSLRPAPLSSPLNALLKRAMDIAVSAAALVALSPLMALIAILVRLDSPGPVFYRQDRVGLKGRVFRALKFRSMRADAERRTGPVWARRGDARVTRVGRFLRRSSLDELPQFINILKGEMSVAGPRPERPNFVAEFSRRVPRYAERHSVRPGLSGWAQVNELRGNTSVEERVKYDLFYVDNWSLWLDVKILIRTGLEVFHHREAY